MIRTETLSTRVSLRSKANIDVRQVAVSYGGGGHRNAAGFSTAMPQSELESKLLEQIYHVLNPPNPLSLESKI